MIPNSNYNEPVLPFSLLLSRRRAVQCFAAITLWSGFSIAAKGSTDSLVEGKLSVLVDVFVPQDSGPSASQLNIHHKLRDMAALIDNYSLLLSSGLSWLDKVAVETHGSEFSDLALERQDAILKSGLNYPNGTLQQVFVTRIRADIMSLFYHDSRSWVGMLIETPIQPLGYLDFSQKPERI